MNSSAQPHLKLPSVSTCQTLSLCPEQAARLLRLRAHQRCLLRVDAGQLWLTQDGLPNDQVLAPGEPTRLQGPGCFRLGALGAQPVALALIGVLNAGWWRR